MLNNFIIVGRLTQDLEIKELEDGKKVCSITLAVQRCYKNVDGVYDTDFINITLWNIIAENTLEYCRKGDILGVKGRIQTTSYQDEKGENKTKLELIAEKVTFLSSKKEGEK